MTQRVSFITPSYNQGRFIERTIKSVLQQQLSSYEYVVMDGGSTDETVDILKRFSGGLRWVSEKDRGQTHAVNKGLVATSGEIIAWINSDDIYCPGALRAVCEFFDENPAVDVVYGDANYIDETDNVTGPYPTQDWDLERFKECCFISQPAAFMRRTVVERFGLLDEQLHFCMDYDYFLRLARGGARFAHLKQVLAGTRLYPTNKTLRYRERIHVEVLDTLQRICGEVPDQWFLNYAQVIVGQRGVDGISPVSLSFAIAWIAYSAALQWNGTVSEALQKRLRKAEARVDAAWRSLEIRNSILKQEIREAVHTTVPPNSIVLVISKGDDDLLKLDGCQGWHFPQTATGSYAGHHPADSREASEQLEELRRKGAQYLLIPDPSRWWLNHYAGFREHLDSYSRILDTGACVVFDIAQPH